MEQIMTQYGQLGARVLVLRAIEGKPFPELINWELYNDTPGVLATHTALTEHARHVHDLIRTSGTPEDEPHLRAYCWRWWTD
jgi:hypothetical protein